MQLFDCKYICNYLVAQNFLEIFYKVGKIHGIDRDCPFVTEMPKPKNVCAK